MLVIKNIINLLQPITGYSPLLFHGFLRIVWRSMDFVPFKLGIYIRSLIGKKLFKRLGKNSAFRDHNIFSDCRNIEIGDNFIAGKYNYFGGGSIKIGNDVMMANFVIIETTNHNCSDLTKPIRKQGFYKLPVEINDDVWICDRVTILPGVKIGKGSILASSSVITKDVEPYCIMAGNPARVVRKRGGK